MPTLHALICSAIDQISLNQASQGSKRPQQVPLNDSFASTDLESEQPDSQDLALNAVLEQQLDQRNEQILQEIERLKHDANFGNDSEVVTMLRQQLQDSKEQKEEHKQEMDELRGLLGQSLSTQSKGKGKK